MHFQFRAELHAGLPPSQGNQGIQGKSGNLVFSQGKSRRNEEFFENQGGFKFHNLLVGRSDLLILTHTSSWLKVTVFLPFCISFYSVPYL